MRQVRTRPTFSLFTRPDSSSTFRCSITAGSDMGSGRGQVADRGGAAASRSTRARRVGSPSA